MTGHKNMPERAEAKLLTDEELLARCAEANDRLAEAARWRDRVITDAMIRGLSQTLIAKTADVGRRTLFDISDREFRRRQAEESGD